MKKNFLKNPSAIIIFRELSFIAILCCLFLAPSNLFLKMFPQTGYVHNLQVDYLIPKLHLSFLASLLSMLFLIITFFPQEKRSSIWKASVFNFRKVLSFFQTPKILPILVVIFFCRQLLTPFPFSALWTIGVVSLLVLFYQGIKKQLPILCQSTRRKSWLFFSLYASVLLQSLLGIYQFATQHSLLGFIFLGEPDLHHQPFLARGDFFWLDRVIGTNFGHHLLPYGTTPHPNVLAGFLAIGTFIVIKKFRGKTWQKLILIIPLLLCLFLTQSISAGLCLAIGIGLTFLPPKNIANLLNWKIWWAVLLAVPIGLLLINTQVKTPSISRRVVLNQTAWQMFLQHPLAGVGVQQFTAFAEDVQPWPEVVSFTQPAHHVGLLFLAENGILGILLAGVIVKRLQPKNKRLFLEICFLFLPIITLDHYLYSLIQGWWLLLITLLFLSRSSQYISA